MMLTSVEIHAENSSDTVVLSFRDPRALNKYNVKSILGLDADSIVPQAYGISGKAKFNTLSIEKRIIILKLGLNPKFGEGGSYSDLRDALYKIIASNRSGKIQLQFKNGVDVIAAISGSVSKFEAPQFEKMQEVQITVSCDEPMLKGLDPISVVLTGLNPANTLILDDKSTAPHGFTFEIRVTSNIPSLKITDPNDASWSFEIIPAGGFLTGDVLHFSSEYNKALYIVQGANTTYLADVITPGSIWPILFPGENTLSFTHPLNVAWNLISYYPTYWGV